jgi:NADH dehydrogenase/NADH:ubiquinone oxidoreductase subunit G
MDVTLRIDGLEVAAPAGASLLEVARGAGREVPSLCHHEGLAAIASCRLCLVEVRRPGREAAQLTTACDYPVSAGLEVTTDSALLARHRAMNLQLLLPRAPEAPVLLGLAARLGVTAPLFPPVSDAPLPGCILCELCVRICAALGYHALAAIGRGERKHVGPPFGQAAAKACVGCGSCEAACPTRCIAMQDTATTRTIWGRSFELLACERCGRPITTREHAAAMIAATELPEMSSRLCDICKKRLTSERLAMPGR